MKFNLIIRIWVLCLLFTAVLGGCRKEAEPSDPNQPVTDQLKAVTDSILKNSQVPGIVALVVDHKLGIDWLYSAGYCDIPSKLPANPTQPKPFVSGAAPRR
jgi:hypothetical protein